MTVGDRQPESASPSIYIELTVMGLIFGVSPVASKFAAEELPVFTVSALRVLIAGVAFVPVIALLEPRWPRVTVRDAGWFLLLGSTGFLGFSALYFFGLQRTTASHGVVVFGSGPAVTALFSAWLLRERITAERAAGIGLTVAGVGLIVIGTGGSLAGGSVVGDLAMLGAITSWSFYGILARPVIARFGPLVVTAYSVMAGALLLTPLALLDGASPSTVASASGDAWAGLLFSGLFSTILAYVIWNRGVRAIGPTLTMLFSNTAPVWGFLTAFLLRGEAITVWHFASGVLVVGGVLLANWRGLMHTLAQRDAAKRASPA